MLPPDLVTKFAISQFFPKNRFFFCLIFSVFLREILQVFPILFVGCFSSSCGLTPALSRGEGGVHSLPEETSPLLRRGVRGEAELQFSPHTLPNPVALDFFHRIAEVNFF